MWEYSDDALARLTGPIRRARNRSQVVYPRVGIQTQKNPPTLPHQGLPLLRILICWLGVYWYDAQAHHWAVPSRDGVSYHSGVGRIHVRASHPSTPGSQCSNIQL